LAFCSTARLIGYAAAHLIESATLPRERIVIPAPSLNSRQSDLFQGHRSAPRGCRSGKTLPPTGSGPTINVSPWMRVDAGIADMFPRWCGLEGNGQVMAKSAAAVRSDPYRNFRFRVEIDGIVAAGFSEVQIGETVTDVIDYREGNEPAHVRKLPGLHKFGNVTLMRGMMASMELVNWHRQVQAGDNARRNVVVVVMDESGTDQARFVIHAAWPAKYAIGALNGNGNEALIEILELVNEGIERVA
jgi:phage tail-like protein